MLCFMSRSHTSSWCWSLQSTLRTYWMLPRKTSLLIRLTVPSIPATFTDSCSPSTSQADVSTVVSFPSSCRRCATSRRPVVTSFRPGCRILSFTRGRYTIKIFSFTWLARIGSCATSSLRAGVQTLLTRTFMCHAHEQNPEGMRTSKKIDLLYSSWKVI